MLFRLRHRWSVGRADGMSGSLGAPWQASQVQELEGKKKGHID